MAATAVSQLPVLVLGVTMASKGSGCKFKCQDFIVQFHKQDDLGVHFLRWHSVAEINGLVNTVWCSSL